MPFSQPWIHPRSWTSATCDSRLPALRLDPTLKTVRSGNHHDTDVEMPTSRWTQLGEDCLPHLPLFAGEHLHSQSELRSRALLPFYARALKSRTCWVTLTDHPSTGPRLAYTFMRDNLTDRSAMDEAKRFSVSSRAHLGHFHIRQVDGRS